MLVTRIGRSGRCWWWICENDGVGDLDDDHGEIGRDHRLMLCLGLSVGLVQYATGFCVIQSSYIGCARCLACALRWWVSCHPVELHDARAFFAS